VAEGLLVTSLQGRQITPGRSDNLVRGRPAVLSRSGQLLGARALALWTVVYIAANMSVAEMLREVLTKEGLLVMLRSCGIPHFGASGSVELLVPEVEVEEANEVLAGVLGVP